MAGFSVQPFAWGLLGKDLGLFGGGVPNPVTPVLAFALDIVALVLHFIFLVDQVPINLLILGAIIGLLALALGRRASAAREPGPWKTMGEIDFGVGAVAVGFSIYEILSEK